MKPVEQLIITPDALQIIDKANLTENHVVKIFLPIPENVSEQQMRDYLTSASQLLKEEFAPAHIIISTDSDLTINIEEPNEA